MSWTNVSRLAARQHGLVTLEQLTAHGVTRSTRRTWISHGWLVPVHGRLLRLEGSPITWEQTVRAACLGAGDPVAVSHATALVLHGLEPGELHGADDLVEIVVPHRRRLAVAHATVHRTRRWPARIPHLGGIPTMPLARTIVDLSGRVSTGQLGRWMDEGRRSRRLTVRDVDAVLDQIGPGTSRRLGRAERAVEPRRTRGPGASAPEVDLYALIVSAGLPAPVQNHRIRVGGRRFELDLAYPDRRIAIEYDSWTHHGGRDRFDRDRSKDRALVVAGWQPLRVTSNTDPDEFVDDLRQLLRHHAA